VSIWLVFAAVVAPGFILKDMTIQNTAGPAGEQAVALRAGGDQQAFSNLNIEGYQVLVMSNSSTQISLVQYFCSNDMLKWHFLQNVISTTN
jgi:pectin methylesterase-like acyl-CoA thioesterase